MTRYGWWSCVSTCALVVAGALALSSCTEGSFDRGPAAPVPTSSDDSISAAKVASLGHAAPAEGNFDRRVITGPVARAAAVPQPSQTQAIDDLRASVGALAVRLDPATGVTRSLSSPAGYLTLPDRSGNPKAIALAFVQRNAALLGLAPGDLEYEVTDVVYSAVTGATHVYLRQLSRGIPVYGGQLQVHVNRDGRILGLSNAFVPGLASAVSTVTPSVSASAAVTSASAHAGHPLAQPPRELAATSGPRRDTKVDETGVSREPIEARLALLPVGAGNVRLVWQVVLYTLDGRHAYETTVDADDGTVWTRVDWVSKAQYRVYPRPVESPNHTTPVPPDDGRVLVTDPADPTASPYGWHDLDGVDGADTTGLNGNNVHAYDDANDDNAPPSVEPACADGLACDFAMDLTLEPTEYVPAAVTNLFYWTNVVHDVQYRYGFDEQAGNFQWNNYGKGGLGQDELHAEAQDGRGMNNANFMTPPDGSSPRMQMFLWNYSVPMRDGDFDSGIIVHEFGHGISNRQVGGPSNTSCLWNDQQPGEGWSDWLSLVYTAKQGDQGTDGRGMGTYSLGEPTDGPGIREQRYSTDPTINTWTYESIRTAWVPHGVGSVWAEVLWKMYWKLVDAHGFGPNLYDAAGGAGNQRAMLYVNEGMKLTACNPTFLDARDAIVQAAADNWGGEDVCRIWEAFAAFGLGTDAWTDGSNESATNGFELPLECQCQPPPIADAGPDTPVCLGGSVTLGGPEQPYNSYLWSPGGETTSQITVTPTATTTYTVTATTTCGSRSDSAVVVVDDGTLAIGLSDDFELPASAWTTSGLWHQVTDSTCASPAPGYASASTAMYYGLDSSCTYDTGSPTTGDLVSPVIYGVTAGSTLRFDYFKVAEPGYDKTDVSVSTDDGGRWTKIWSADSPGAVDARWANSGFIPLGAFAGSPLRIRFHFYGDYSINGFVGWLVDDVVVTGLSPCHTGNNAPTLDLFGPRDGATVPNPVPLEAGAYDFEDGDLTGSIHWTSSLDGPIGSGGSIERPLSLGTHVITATVTDTAGVTATSTTTITVVDDTEPPQVWLVSPADGSIQSGWVYIEARATDNGTISEVDFYIDGSLAWASTTPPHYGYWDIDSASSGTHVIQARAIDRNGNIGESDPVTVTKYEPSAPPVVSITSPLDGAAVSGVVDVAISATDSDGTVTRVDLYVDGSPYASTFTEPYVIAWDSTPYSQGGHWLQAFAYDDSGTEGYSQTVTVFIAVGEPPVVSITSPAPDSTVSGMVDVAISASDPDGTVTEVDLYVNGSYVGWAQTAPYVVQWNSSYWLGWNTLRAYAWDDSGNVMASPEVQVYVAPDLPPVVAITSPVSGETVTGDVDVEIEASDPDGSIARVELYVDGGWAGYTDTEPYVVHWSSNGYVGRRVLQAQAFDDVWQGTYSAEVVVNVVGDRSPPQLTVVQPVEGATLTGNVTIQAQASDDVGVSSVYMYPSEHYLYFLGGPPYGMQWPSDEVDNGPLALKFEAYDYSNNVNTVVVHVTVDNPGHAWYDADLETPACLDTGDHCVSSSLLDGRGPVGPESHAPNTIGSSCADGGAGMYWRDEYVTSMVVYSVDGLPMEAGKPVAVSVVVNAFSDTDDFLDIYQAADATSPTWQLVATLQPTRTGLESLGTSFVLPQGTLQAVRAQFRYQGVETPCSEGPFDDHDDLVFAVVSDTTPPVVAVSSPGSGAVVSGTPTVSVSASDDRAVTEVEIWIDGALADVLASPPYTYAWPTAAEADGAHALSARAYDAAGNVGFSPTVSVIVDNGLPSATITSPASGATVGGLVPVSIISSDGAGVARVELYDGSTLVATAKQPPASVQLTWNAAAAAPGSHALSAVAYDLAGHASAPSTVTVTVTIDDSTPPTVAVTRPHAEALLRGIVPFQAIASDDHGVSGVELIVDGIVIATDVTAPYGVYFDTRTVANGSHELRARAIDFGGNVAITEPVYVFVIN